MLLLIPSVFITVQDIQLKSRLATVILLLQNSAPAALQREACRNVLREPF